jgi:xanthine dehydrogenase accessory factor
MAVSESGQIAGGVSGGCVDGDVKSRAEAVLKGSPAELVNYGVSDELAASVGLSCGGEIEILIEPLSPSHLQLMDAIEGDRPAVLISSLKQPLGASQLLEAEPDIATWLETDRPERRNGTLIEPFPRSPQLIIIGATHVGVALCAQARTLGFRVTVIEPRAAFSGEDRLSSAERIIRSWPDQALKELRVDGSTYIAVLSHDPKFEDPAIISGLAARPRYLGAIGSRGTQEKRLTRLRSAGVADEELARIHAPIGLDIGARTAEETALAILAEMIAVRNGRGGGRLGSMKKAAPATA